MNFTPRISLNLSEVFSSFIAGPVLSTQSKAVLQKDATDFNGCNTVELQDTKVETNM